jgi:peptidyl-prolyl cis-trans isomerase D
MSLLEKMRSSSDSSFMQLVFIAIVIAFIFAYGQTSGDTVGTVATVNGTPIRTTDWQREYRLAERGASGSLDETARDMLGERVKRQMVEKEVALQEAEALGLQVSKAELAAWVLDQEYFKEDGRFNEKRYQAIIRQQGFTRAEFEDRVREDLLRNKLTMLLWMGTTVAEPEVKQAFVESDTRIDLNYVRVRPSMFHDDIRFTDAEVDAWLGENEQRAKETYDSDFARMYDVPDKYRARVLRFEILEDGVSGPELEERMKGLKAELEGGADFDALARRWSEDPSAVDGGDLGLLTESQLGSKVVSALSGLEAGAMTDVMVNEREVRLYRFEGKEAAHIVEFDTAKRDIARTLMTEDQAPTRAAGFAEDLLAKWTEAGSAPTELLDAQELTVQSTGPIPLAGDVRGGAPSVVIDAARSLEAGAMVDRVIEAGGVYWVVSLRSRTEADMDRYETERERIREQVLAQKRQLFSKNWLDSAVAAANVR